MKRRCQLERTLVFQIAKTKRFTKNDVTAMNQNHHAAWHRSIFHTVMQAVVKLVA